MKLIDNYEELVALHRALLEVKFSGNCKDEVLPFSEFIANISNKVVDEIIEYNKQGKGNKLATTQDWVNWRVLEKNQPEWNAILENIQKIDEWRQSLKSEKENTVKWLASPFILTEKSLNELITEGDNKHL